jgi:hypothetical protein
MPSLVWDKVPSRIDKEYILEERIKQIYTLNNS